MIVRVPDSACLGLASFDSGTERFVDIDGEQVLGRVAVTFLETSRGLEAIAHDLFAEPSAPQSCAARLVQAVRRAVRERGLTSYAFTVMTDNAHMLEHCIKAVMKPEAVTFRAQV